jgi:hypothetical protein
MRNWLPRAGGRDSEIYKKELERPRWPIGEEEGRKEWLMNGDGEVRERGDMSGDGI